MTSSYDQLLNMLADDEQLAADRYLLIRAKLIMYFEGRRVSPSEDHADEVLHRVAKKIDAGEEIKDVNRYVFGVARFVMLEAFHQPQMQAVDEVLQEGMKTPAVLSVSSPVVNDEADTPMQTCLRECLLELRDDKRKLLLDYYEIDEASGHHIEQRKRLAARLNKTPGALQKEICLLRKKVSECSHDCVKRELR